MFEQGNSRNPSNKTLQGRETKLPLEFRRCLKVEDESDDLQNKGIGR
jgi:hypothetical protein